MSSTLQQRLKHWNNSPGPNRDDRSRHEG
jgi:hypothetical protein